MIANITKGRKAVGAILYDFGPGRRDEHVNPRIVAGNVTGTPMQVARAIDHTARQRPEIKAPIFLAFGDKEPFIPGTAFNGLKDLGRDIITPFMTRMMAANNRPILKIYPDTGHFIHTDNPVEFPADVTDFVSTGFLDTSSPLETDRLINGVVSAVADDNVLFIATSNNVSALPPELLRRFKYGVVFFDLPSAAERETIWAIYRKHFRIPAEMAQPPDQGWTGDEIRTCCELSWQLGCSLEEASAYIIPVSIRAADQLKELRSQANYRYLSASYPGPYLMDKAEAAQGPSPRMYVA